jgi:hypothetical protein
MESSKLPSALADRQAAMDVARSVDILIDTPQVVVEETLVTVDSIAPSRKRVRS